MFLATLSRVLIRGTGSTNALHVGQSNHVWGTSLARPFFIAWPRPQTIQELFLPPWMIGRWPWTRVVILVCTTTTNIWSFMKQFNLCSASEFSEIKVRSEIGAGWWLGGGVETVLRSKGALWSGWLMLSRQSWPNLVHLQECTKRRWNGWKAWNVTIRKLSDQSQSSRVSCLSGSIFVLCGKTSGLTFAVDTCQTCPRKQTYTGHLLNYKLHHISPHNIHIPNNLGKHYWRAQIFI